MGLFSFLLPKAAPRPDPPQVGPAAQPAARSAEVPAWPYGATDVRTPGPRPHMPARVDKPGSYLHQATSGDLWVEPASSFGRSVVGESHYQQALFEICGGAYARDGHCVHCDAFLHPEPHNAHDPNAVRVEIEGKTVGYLGRDDAAKYNAQLAKGGLIDRPVTCRAKIIGGSRSNQHNAKHLGVKLAFNWPLKVLGA